MQRRPRPRPAGTLIYSIAYDSTQNCTDNSGALPQRARPHAHAETSRRRTPQTDTYFYNQPAYGDLTDIFTQISQALAQINTRLIPSP